MVRKLGGLRCYELLCEQCYDPAFFFPDCLFSCLFSIPSCLTLPRVSAFCLDLLFSCMGEHHVEFCICLTTGCISFPFLICFDHITDIVFVVLLGVLRCLEEETCLRHCSSLGHSFLTSVDFVLHCVMGMTEGSGKQFCQAPSSEEHGAADHTTCNFRTQSFTHDTHLRLLLLSELKILEIVVWCCKNINTFAHIKLFCCMSVTVDDVCSS